MPTSLIWLVEALVAYYTLAIILDHAHLACPIWLGWGNRGFRRVMLERPEKFILLPAFCVGIPLLVGTHVTSTHDPLFRALAVTYAWWNAWHFGSQHSGVAALAGALPKDRWLRQLRQSAIVWATMAIILVPHAGIIPLMIFNEVISFAHWTTDISLTAWLKRWWFVPLVLAVGFSGFLFKTVAVNSPFCAGFLACPVKYSFPPLAALRYGLGFWHFLMSRWVWQWRYRALFNGLLAPAT